jgi:hypothetical protein
VEAITGVDTISTDAASDPDILPSPMAGFTVVVMQGFTVVAAMEGAIGKRRQLDFCVAITKMGRLSLHRPRISEDLWAMRASVTR